jgi:hypothetical protein
MKKIILVLFIAAVTFSTTFAQIKSLAKHAQMKVDCKQCHVCDTPTKADPCLILCPRYKIEVVRHSPDEGPNEIIIDKIKTDRDLYKPVKFSHRLHSEMSLMSGGCSACHHFNPPGKIVKCDQCHELKRSRTDLSKPDLKAAYHRQCMDCHYTWDAKVECAECHALNSAPDVKKEKETKPVNVHPKVKEPTKVIYETGSDEGNIVTFFHNEHTSLFNLECTDCHDDESCAKCHNQKELIQKSPLEDAHEKCSSCHDTEDNCSSCHMEKERKPFNHAKATGFNLNKYHSKVACISCHSKDKVFKGLDKNCSSCHDFENEDFDHSVTGIELDDIHIENDCSDCHTESTYSKVSCENCHDEDITYPDYVPGYKK